MNLFGLFAKKPSDQEIAAFIKEIADEAEGRKGEREAVIHPQHIGDDDQCVIFEVNPTHKPGNNFNPPNTKDD